MRKPPVRHSSLRYPPNPQYFSEHRPDVNSDVLEPDEILKKHIQDRAWTEILTLNPLTTKYMSLGLTLKDFYKNVQLKQLKTAATYVRNQLRLYLTRYIGVPLDELSKSRFPSLSTDPELRSKLIILRRILRDNPNITRKFWVFVDRFYSTLVAQWGNDFQGNHWQNYIRSTMEKQEALPTPPVISHSPFTSVPMNMTTDYRKSSRPLYTSCPLRVGEHNRDSLLSQI
ncbi:hypothetical protein B0H10DRAFT_1987472 [Mycena sp. CBHHK59/15]|nr:hypothetical protein B0H10DRAFT_1987472 [Mycena sp. CBHHK59/15]